MNFLTFSDIKRKGAKSIPDDEVSYLIVNSRPKTAMVPIDTYEKMLEMIEDSEDIKSYLERKNDETIPAKEFFRKLGI